MPWLQDFSLLMALVVLARTAQVPADRDTEHADVEEPENVARASSTDELGVTAANGDL